ncbi:MAG: xanthine dehydrogenase accessory protein XdhC, partial [Kiloniellales bacterium]|nr:xanthine dehydrogenase accessory protein XdhC [Kiloniellales bacterium]
MSWARQALDLLEKEDRIVLVTVAAVQGSAPRGPGAKMLVSSDGISGSIGGGQLEYRAMGRANEILREGKNLACLEDFPLGPSLGQCCGGFAKIAFEVLGEADRDWLSTLGKEVGNATVHSLRQLAGGGTFRSILDGADVDSGIERLGLSLPNLTGGSSDTKLIESEDGELFLLDVEQNKARDVYLFGAGHVGTALVRALAPLPFRICWVDSRKDVFPKAIPADVEPLIMDPPHHAVAKAPEGTIFLVMTHSHPLDLDVCEAVLKNGRFAYLGLIGSATKRVRFAKRLIAR